MRSIVTVALSATMLLAGCSLLGGGSDDPPPTLGATYQMVDSSGNVVGKVVFTPLGQGQVIDAKGTLIGNIVKPRD
jgi:hypothetical protein